MTAAAWLDEFRTEIRAEVERVFRGTAGVAEAYDPLAAHLHQALRDLTLRSTGLGAAFTLAVVRGGDRDWRTALPAAAAIDLLAGATLITDDMIDCDETRWGVPSLHARYRDMARDLGRRDPERFGRCVGAVAADVLTSLAYSTVAAAELPEDVRCELLVILAEAQRRVDLSQLLDLQFEETFPSVEDWERMAANRAAAHLQASLRAGAVLTRLAPSDTVHLIEAGHFLGLLYDVRADLLDTFGKPSARRVIGRDLAMRKKPLFLCAALVATDGDARDRLRRMIAAPEVPVAGVKEIASGPGLATALERLREYAAACREAFLRTGLSSEAKAFFLDMIARGARAGALGEDLSAS